MPGLETVCRDYSLSCTDSDGREGSRGNLNGNQREIRYVLCCRGRSGYDGRVSDDVSVFLWGINLVCLKFGGKAMRVIIIIVCATGVILVVTACMAIKTVSIYELD